MTELHENLSRNSSAPRLPTRMFPNLTALVEELQNKLRTLQSSSTVNMQLIASENFLSAVGRTDFSNVITPGKLRLNVLSFTSLIHECHFLLRHVAPDMDIAVELGTLRDAMMEDRGVMERLGVAHESIHYALRPQSEVQHGRWCGITSTCLLLAEETVCGYACFIAFT